MHQQKRNGLTRRLFMAHAGVASLALASGRAWAQDAVDLGFGNGDRPFTTAFPQKGRMLLQRTRPPLLETPFDVFDKGVFTPTDQFFVRWHWAVIPTDIDVEKFRLKVFGAVNKEVSLSLSDIQALPAVEMAAVNQCSGNSRGFFSPRVPGGQWGNGAMGNARWTGVLLRDVLDRAGIKAGALTIRFNGLDEPVVSDGPDFKKSLSLDHARDGEVMIAYAMNGEPLPLLNGFPLRLIVPGWYSTYWVKMLSDIEVLSQPDDNFWMKTAYTIPDNPQANMTPGQTGVKMVPINKMVPRSFVTNLAPNQKLANGDAVDVRGIAMGGDTGVGKVDLSVDGGRTWQPTTLGSDSGKYSFRPWQTKVKLSTPGTQTLMVRCTNTDGISQPAQPNWNPSGFMRNVIESIPIQIV